MHTRGKRETDPASIRQYMVLTSIVRGNADPERVVPFLTAIAQDTTERDMVRATAIDGLRLRDGQARSAVPVLRSLLSDDPLGSAAAAALARIQPDESVAQTLVPWLQHKNREIRLLALSGAMYLGPRAKPAVPALAGTLLDGKTVVPGLIALGRIGPGAVEAAPAVAGLLNAGDAEIRLTAAVALFRIDSSRRPQVLQVVGDWLVTGKPDDQYRILDVLGNFGPGAAAALPALRQLAEKGQYPALRQAARRTIAKVAP